MDATANDVPDDVQGFPTIKLYKAGDKANPIEYSGDRTIEDLANFVKENGKYGASVDVGTKGEGKATDGVGDGEEMGKAAPAATEGGVKEKVVEKVKEAAEAVKTAVMDSDGDVHDEL